MIVVINKNIVTEACVYPVAVCLATVNAISFLNLSLDNQSKLDGSIIIFFNNVMVCCQYQLEQKWIATYVFSKVLGRI